MLSYSEKSIKESRGSIQFACDASLDMDVDDCDGSMLDIAGVRYGQTVWSCKKGLLDAN